MKRDDELDALERARLERDRVRHGLGWDGQELPRGMRPGKERPVYVWDTGKGLEIEMVFVPAGAFLHGPRKERRETGAFFIARRPATWRDFRVFCADSGRSPPADPHWGAFDDHPVVNVPWSDAASFCAWAGLRLPRAFEWEKAARGTDGRDYPWGIEKPTPERCIFADHPVHGERSTAPAGSCPLGASPAGALDMIGNVWEWCDDRLARGGSFASSLPLAGFPAREQRADQPAVDGGFRPVRPA